MEGAGLKWMSEPCGRTYIRRPCNHLQHYTIPMERVEIKAQFGLWTYRSDGAGNIIGFVIANIMSLRWSESIIKICS
jgi:hypothetical protein